MTLTDPEVVRRDYGSELRLLDRRSIYDGSDGPSAWDVIWAYTVEASPRSVLEVGPGPGELAERMVRKLRAEIVAIDISPRMVELTRARGVDARIGDVQELPVPDRSFDLVGAGWVLFHPADLDRALAEIARVPSGRRSPDRRNEQRAPSLRALDTGWTWSSLERRDGPAATS